MSRKEGFQAHASINSSINNTQNAFQVKVQGMSLLAPVQLYPNLGNN